MGIATAVRRILLEQPLTPAEGPLGCLLLRATHRPTVYLFFYSFYHEDSLVLQFLGKGFFKISRIVLTINYASC